MRGETPTTKVVEAVWANSPVKQGLPAQTVIVGLPAFAAKGMVKDCLKLPPCGMMKVVWVVPSHKREAVYPPGVYPLPTKVTVMPAAPADGFTLKVGCAYPINTALIQRKTDPINL
jgi:hypothetical protein